MRAQCASAYKLQLHAATVCWSSCTIDAACAALRRLFREDTNRVPRQRLTSGKSFLARVKITLVVRLRRVCETENRTNRSRYLAATKLQFLLAEVSPCCCFVLHQNVSFEEGPFFVLTAGTAR